MQALLARCAIGKADVSHISDEQMKEIMKAAVDSLYRLLWQKEHDPERWRRNLALGKQYTIHWDDPGVKLYRPGYRNNEKSCKEHF